MEEALNPLKNMVKVSKELLAEIYIFLQSLNLSSLKMKTQG
jgi:hypothetical protein